MFFGWLPVVKLTSFCGTAKTFEFDLPKWSRFVCACFLVHWNLKRDWAKKKLSTNEKKRTTCFVIFLWKHQFRSHSMAKRKNQNDFNRLKLWKHQQWLTETIGNWIWRKWKIKSENRRKTKEERAKRNGFRFVVCMWQLCTISIWSRDTSSDQWKK